ncbi:MAG TPA: hypothetical protein VMU45_01775 [Candidatus Eisenbacteria bacterium]|nr:hypothetical protein [Candidatus Eisenbacteria bacterium]
MKRILIFVLAVSCCALAQGGADITFQAPIRAGAIAIGAFGGPGPAVKGAPYSATITNENVQTLADGTHITQTSTGSTARDSQGRTRQDAPLPSLGNLAASDAPHLVFLQDPVAGTSYTLNLTDKTAWKNPMLPGGVNVTATGVTTTTNTFFVHTGGGAPPDLPPPPPMVWQKHVEVEDAGDVTTENLDSQMIEGVQVTGVRTTRTIPVGKIGNDRPIAITTEVWTSPELKTVVLSKRNDPRTGEQTFKLTNIQRTEPDPSLFTVPSDFKVTESGAETIIYRTKH